MTEFITSTSMPSNLGGGIGNMISSFNNPFFMGIDRFNSRKQGSLYAWLTQSNDPYHLSYEPNQWVAEFPTKIRQHDPAVHAVSIMDFNAIAEDGVADIRRLATLPSIYQTISAVTTRSKSTTNTHVSSVKIAIKIQREITVDVTNGITGLHVCLRCEQQLCL